MYSIFGVPDYGSNPQFLGIHISPHKVVPRGRLDHGLHFTPYPVHLSTKQFRTTVLYQLVIYFTITAPLHGVGIFNLKEI